MTSNLMIVTCSRLFWGPLHAVYLHSWECVPRAAPSVLQPCVKSTSLDNATVHGHPKVRTKLYRTC